jgi:hypothetical protein
MLSPRIHVTIKTDLKDRLEKESEKLNVSQASIINMALSEHFNKKDNDAEKKN